MVNVLVVGPGALGISTAVRLAKSGHNVTVAARTEKSAAQLQAQGLRLSLFSGELESARLRVISDPKELDQKMDVLILAIKIGSALASVSKWISVLAEEGIFIPYQNGLLGDDFAKICDERLVECAVYYGATLIEPGYSRMTGPGHLHLGPWPRGAIEPGSRTERAAAILSSVVPTYVYDDMFSVKWNKLFYNSAATSLGVISGFNLAEMMQHAVVRSSFLDILAESYAIAMAAGVKPLSLGGINASLFVRLPRFIANIALRLAARRFGEYKSSSQQSLERGEPTEVDFLNGRVVSEARRLGLKTPWNRAVVETVHEVEADPQSAGLSKVQMLREKAAQDGS